MVIKPGPLAGKGLVYTPFLKCELYLLSPAQVLPAPCSAAACMPQRLVWSCPGAQTCLYNSLWPVDKMAMKGTISCQGQAATGKR